MASACGPGVELKDVNWRGQHFNTIKSYKVSDGVTYWDMDGKEFKSECLQAIPRENLHITTDVPMKQVTVQRPISPYIPHHSDIYSSVPTGYFLKLAEDED
jgi:hypothetical protein